MLQLHSDLSICIVYLKDLWVKNVTKYLIELMIAARISLTSALQNWIDRYSVVLCAYVWIFRAANPTIFEKTADLISFILSLMVEILTFCVLLSWLNSVEQ